MRWIGAVREDMQEAGVEEKDTGGREKWRTRTCYGNAKWDVPKRRMVLCTYP